MDFHKKETEKIELVARPETHAQAQEASSVGHEGNHCNLLVTHDHSHHRVL